MVSFDFSRKAKIMVKKNNGEVRTVDIRLLDNKNTDAEET